jgi:hypothetical protein
VRAKIERTFSHTSYVWKRDDNTAFVVIRPLGLKKLHRRSRHSTVYLQDSGLWVRGGKGWVERLTWDRPRISGHNKF